MIRPGERLASRPAPALDLALTLLTITIVAQLGLPQRSAAGPAELTSPSARGAQFVFVIDDSKSMRERTGGYAAADPDRLAVFAIESLLAMLDPGDEASVVRLNAAREGAPLPPLAPLTPDHRARLVALLADDQPLASYAGSYTPCRSALAATGELLERAYRQNVAQVVIFLSDGDCTPKENGEELPDAAAFLAGLRSHQEELFRLYLLRFRGRPYTPELERLATLSGGQAIEFGGDDPTAMLEPFADALTRSQGYEAELLAPGRDELAAHRGARRVRLLAIAPGAGDPLSFAIADFRGQSPRLLGETRSGVHNYPPDGRTYRWAALDYSPIDSPVTVRVAGAADWKVIAVPEYRLRVEMEIRAGPCDQPGPPLRHATEAGSTVCAVVQLVNEQGRPVERGAAGGEVEAAVLYRRGGEPTTSLPADPAGDLAEFHLQRTGLDRGDHSFTPQVTLRLPGRTEPATFAGRAHGLQATSIRITVTPAAVDFGELRPGESSRPIAVTLDGNFSPAPARLEAAPRNGLPSCVTFTAGGEAEGVPLQVAPGQSVTVVAHAAPYCGLVGIDERYEPVLRLALEGGSSGLTPAPPQIAASVRLVYRIELPRPVTVSLTAGEDAEVAVALAGNHPHPFALEALLEEPEERSGWPGDDLELTFAAGDGERGATATAGALTFDPAVPGSPLRLRVRSHRCCPTGSYDTELALLPAPGAAYSGAPPEPIRVPVHVEVAGAGFWTCRGSTIAWALALLLALLLAVYVFLMVRNSRFLDRDRLADALVPLRWEGHGTRREPKARDEVRSMVRRDLTLAARAMTWLKANPLVFGLPGGAYRETVELTLQPERDVDRSSLRLIAERDLYRRLQEEPATGLGRLFAHAVGDGAAEYFGVPARGRLGGLLASRAADAQGGAGPDGAQRPRIFRLRRREELIDPVPDNERQEGRAAGWQVG